MSDSLKIGSRSASAIAKKRANREGGEAAWVVDENVEVKNGSQREETIKPDSRNQMSEGQQDRPAPPELPLSLLGEEPEEVEKPSALDIKRLLIGVWRRKWVVIIIAGLISSSALALAVFGVNKTWTARSVLIKKEKLDQFSVGNSINPYRPQQYSFETMLGTLKLPTVLERAMARSGVQALPRIFASQIRVSRAKDSNLFEIFVEWDSPELAAKLANNLSSIFIDYNRTMRSDEAASAYEYFSSKLAEVDRKAGVLDKQIQTFRKEKNIIDIQKQGEAWISIINSLEFEERTMAAELDEMRKTKLNLQALYESEPEMTIATTLYRNPLKVKKAALEISLEEIRGRYTDQNPKVIDLMDQIASVDRLITEGGDSDTQENTYRPNPLLESLRFKLLEQDDNISIKSAQYQSVKASLEEARDNLKDFTDTREKFNTLVAERSTMSELLDDLRDRVEEVSVVMQGAQSDFEVIEPAIPPSESNPTTKRLIAIAGVVLGGGAGLLVALLLEFFDSRVRTRKEVIGLTGAEHVFEIQQVRSIEKHRCALSDPDTEMAVLIRRMINELETESGQSLPNLIAVSSIGRDVGRSTLVHSLAIVSAQKRVNTLVIDADMGLHVGYRSFDSAKTKTGLSDLLAGRSSLNQIVQKSESKQLRYISAGSEDSRGREAMRRLSSKSMSNLVGSLRRSEARVLIDLPPVDEYEQVFELLQHTGSVLLVVRSGHTDKARIKTMCERLARADIRVIGVVITDVPEIYADQPKQFFAKG